MDRKKRQKKRKEKNGKILQANSWLRVPILDELCLLLYLPNGLPIFGFQMRLFLLAASSRILSPSSGWSSIRPLMGKRPCRDCFGGQVCWISFALSER
jgi:hypothetical protein